MVATFCGWGFILSHFLEFQMKKQLTFFKTPIIERHWATTILPTPAYLTSPYVLNDSVSAAVTPHKLNVDRLQYALCTICPLCLEDLSHNHGSPSLHFISTQIPLPPRSPPWSPPVPFLLSLLNLFFFRALFFSLYDICVLLIIGLSQPMRASEVQGLVCWAQPIPAVFCVWLGTESVLNSYGKKYTEFPKILRICPQLLENDIPQAVATPLVGQEAATECPPGLGQKPAVPYHQEPLEGEEPGTTRQL